MHRPRVGMIAAKVLAEREEHTHRVGSTKERLPLHFKTSTPISSDSCAKTRVHPRIGRSDRLVKCFAKGRLFTGGR